MSGVYIKGMEMPEDRPQLLWVYPNGKALTVQSDVDPWKDLQAIPVPPHGRCIDADALKASLAFAEKTAEWAVSALRAVLMVIDEMPTIFPAEEGEA